MFIIRKLLLVFYQYHLWLQFADTWEEFYMSHWKRIKRWGRASLISLSVWFKWQATTQTQLTQPANHAPSKKKSQENSRLEGCPEGQIGICNHSALCKLCMSEKIILHLCDETFVQSGCNHCKIYQEIPSVPTDCTGLYSEFWWEKHLSESVTSLQGSGQESMRISCYLPTWISFLFCKAQIGMNRGKERNDSISSQEECQNLDYTQGKEKTEGNVALLREAWIVLVCPLVHFNHHAMAKLYSHWRDPLPR